MRQIKQLIATVFICAQLALKGQNDLNTIDPIVIDSVKFVEDQRQTLHEKENDERVDPKIVEIVYNQYFQNGNNSAVTGGIGTEKLIVYGPSLRTRSDKDNHYFQFQTGVDIISSASADNIDDIVSSASRIDGRVYINVNYGKTLDGSNSIINGGIGFSVESDYLSFKSEVGIEKANDDNSRSYSIQFQHFRDDLRWGLVNKKQNYRPTQLIYPKELRYKEWYDVTNRQSYILKIGFTQIVNQRNILGIFADITHQQGLLSTPFHRVYFKDESLRVEQLPNERWKGGIALRFNSFVGGRVILKNTINPYVDSFGIKSISIENETSIKLTPEFILIPSVRFYTQGSARHFKEYGQHEVDDLYYTSDFDLSDFETFTTGIGFKKYFDKKSIEKITLRTISINYRFMQRTNGLNAHIISTSFLMNK